VLSVYFSDKGEFIAGYETVYSRIAFYCRFAGEPFILVFREPYFCVPLTCTPLLHASEHITILSQLREALPSNNKLLTFRSPEPSDFIVYMYPIQCVLKTPDVRAVIDTGAQLSAAKDSEEILQHTNTSHSMQGAFGQPTTMKGILMGCSTVDIQGLPSPLSYQMNQSPILFFPTASSQLDASWRQDSR
jgi:hypothetical protein